MTRETKIGLLVGLAFIIVIGILLSDHLTSTNEPQQAQLAKTMGEELVPAGQGNQNNAKTASATALPAGAKQYKAEAGDSVSKLAAKFLGANTKANRDAIITANPSHQQNANMVIVGRTYVI